MLKKRKKSKTHIGDYSRISHHKYQDKKLIPPLMQIPNVSLASWRNERLPGLLWAALIVGNTDRDVALSLFREVANYISQNSANGNLGEITHTALSKIDRTHYENIVKLITASPFLRKILRPLLLFESLPNKDIWSKFIADQPTESDWMTLMGAVVKTLDHQSQESTDCRWLRVICMAAAGRVYLRRELSGFAREIEGYPNYGDMRAVQPSIRSAEGAFSSLAPEDKSWANNFWKECLEKTTCFPLSRKQNSNDNTTKVENIGAFHSLLARHFLSTQETTDIDAKHDSVFGFAFYGLRILHELSVKQNAIGILGRLGLRTMLECFLTLSYMIKSKDPEIWKTYRVYGNGQAKLAFLKLAELDNLPDFVNVDVLENLADEDAWMEFLTINVGHWERTSLREMSIKSNNKNEYDKYYSWSSTFSHGQWCAVRDACFLNCANPLHRLHRVPDPNELFLESAIMDAICIMNKILDLLETQYPGFKDRISCKEEKIK